MLLESVRLAVSAGIELIQIREKHLPARLLFDLAVKTVSITTNSATNLLINERFDIAIAAGAFGVHLTSTSVPIEQVRANVPQGFLIGVSAHSRDDVIEAQRSGADYAVLGPAFLTPGKGEPLGIERLEEVCGSIPRFPVIAIGGIDSSNSQSVLESGASGFASIRYLNDFVRIAK